MGYLQKNHRMSLLGKVPEGKCPVCGTAHREESPHNRDSLIYQYKFYDEHGRWPTWKDAMEHCPEEIKEAWIEALTEREVKVE